MEESILKGTKKIVGLAEGYTPFDHDVITHINSAFSSLSQLGIGPELGFMIEDDSALWEDFANLGDASNLIVPQNQMNMIKTYIFLKVRMLFDPPSTSFHIEAMNNQIQEHEWRLNVFREPPPEVVVEVLVDDW